jgi:hypothetical protein
MILMTYLESGEHFESNGVKKSWNLRNIRGHFTVFVKVRIFFFRKKLCFLRGHAREMEREGVKAYDSDTYFDIFGIGGAF